ncbi:hypothetical protein TNCT_400821 [Trichonephila clavata]|uniref:Uncharacterized protein n=1 Tax=Trichonephila clavata TaxID=2740835 RepID=A0A8X6LIA4_TRICU|nr:hypothetical protein TNCT_400821 [Trichonephila clavata]
MDQVSDLPGVPTGIASASLLLYKPEMLIFDFDAGFTNFGVVLRRVFTTSRRCDLNQAIYSKKIQPYSNSIILSIATSATAKAGAKLKMYHAARTDSDTLFPSTSKRL